jgi:hypothetical protein
LTVNDAKEVLVQLYAYADASRSLNALAELMTVLESRQRRGMQDAQGRAPSRAVPKGEALLAAGTANQTRLVQILADESDAETAARARAALAGQLAARTSR